MDYFSPSTKARRRGELYGNKIPSYWSIPFFGVLLLLAYLMQLVHHNMPSPVSVEEAGYNRFSEERAWSYLRRIVGEGPRVAGTAYHRQQTVLLKSMVDEIAASGSRKVHTDWQIVSGDYHLDLSTPYANSYQNASNIIALLEGSRGIDSTSILLNCHYDSVHTSPGASDNSIFCAVLLEILLLLSKRSDTLRHNVIFLFNGAEETSLQASHGFLKHEWAKNITAVVNLDSSGMNGKSVLFQATDPRVLTAYKRSVASPSAQAVGEALFTSGVIPSDTDFRIFRDFGQIYGVDIAFTRYGHVYHTRFDSLELVTPGVIQHAGNTVFSVASEMADSEEFDVKAVEATSAVYYDYLHLFMLSYSHGTATVIDSVIAVVSMASVLFYLWIIGFRWKHTKGLFLCMAALLISTASGAAVVAASSAILSAAMTQLRYYSNAWLVVPLYWTPFYIAAISVLQAFDSWRAQKSGLNRVRRCMQMAAACRLTYSVILVSLTVIPGLVSMRYALSVPLLCASVVSFSTITISHKYRFNAWQHLLLELVASLPALVFTLNLSVSLNALMVPVLGRSVTRTPDHAVAAFNVVMAAFACLPLVGVETLFSRRRLWTSAALVALLSVSLTCVPFAPYSAGSVPAPQRYYVFHTQKTTYDLSGVATSNSSGIWAGHTDANSPRTFVENSRLTGRTDFDEWCSRSMYCGLPMMTTRSMSLVPFSVWIDFPPPPAVSPQPSITLTDKHCDVDSCSMKFAVTGHTHNSLALSPRGGVALLSWSLSTKPLNVTSHLDRPVYFLWHTLCLHGSGSLFTFSVDLSIPSGNTTAELLDVVLNSHITNGLWSEEFRNVIEHMPDWSNIAAYISHRIDYVF